MNVMDQHFMMTALVQVIATGEGGAVLLDLQTDRFLGIDPMGMVMWTLFTTGHTPQEVMSLIAERYAVESEETLQKDIFRFLQQMEAQHLLPQEKLGVDHVPARWPSLAILSVRLLSLLSQVLYTVHASEWLEAWFLLRWVHTFLVRGKLIDLARHLQALPTRHLVTYEHPDVRRLATCVQSAAAWQPFKAVCLHQNLALGFLLRRRAFHADLVIGVSTFPFFAHAWLRSALSVIHWEIGLGPGVSLQRLHDLSVIFCTEWLSDGDGKVGGKR